MCAITLDHGYLSLAEAPKWEAVHARFQSLRLRRCSDDAEEARCIREGEFVQIWRQVGERNMAAYLERMLGYGSRCAYDRLRVARALGDFPDMERALERGELVWSVVRELTRVVAPDTEADWMKAAQGKSLREVEGMVSGRAPGDGPDAPVKPELVLHTLRFEVTAATYADFRESQKALQTKWASTWTTVPFWRFS